MTLSGSASPSSFVTSARTNGVTGSTGHPWTARPSKFQHIPIEDVVVSETLTVEKVPEQLSQVGIVGFVLESEKSSDMSEQSMHGRQ